MTKVKNAPNIEKGQWCSSQCSMLMSTVVDEDDDVYCDLSMIVEIDVLMLSSQCWLFNVQCVQGSIFKIRYIDVEVSVQC